MKNVEKCENHKKEEYIVFLQAIFLLLAGILMTRVWKTNGGFFYELYRNVAFLLLPIVGLISVKIFAAAKKGWAEKKVNDYVNIVYLIVTVPLLIFEDESFFKVLLLLPVMVAALQYGARYGFKWALFSTLGLIIITVFQGMPQIEVFVLILGVIWMFAWLLGKMSEAELESREKLKIQASVDGMTGLLNHRSFYAYLEECFDEAVKNKNSLSLIMLDVDFFKYYNDTYGHRKGDEVLIEIARLIKKAVEEKGECFRYGGDEFAVLIPGGEGQEAYAIGRTICESIGDTSFEGLNILPGGKLSVSVGVASYPEHTNKKEALLEKADEALYRAKYTNNSKVEMYYSVFEEISNLLEGKEKDVLNSMRTLLMFINAKDHYTYGHSERVMNYAMQIGRKMALWEWEVQELMAGALLHDVGKVELSREVLNKSDSLTEEEWEGIRQHPVWGADIIRPISAFKNVVDIILYHHENYDGSGYPDGLKGKDIPLGARILRVVDSFDAMTTNRPYKKGLSVDKAADEIKSLSNVLYDPEVVETFLEYLKEIGILV